MGYIFRYNICQKCGQRQRVQQRRKTKLCAKCGCKDFTVRPSWFIRFTANGQWVEQKVGNEELASKYLRISEAEVARGKFRLIRDRKIILRNFALGDYWNCFASKQKSAKDYMGHLKNHILPVFGEHYLHQIERFEIEKWIAKLDENYPVSTVNRILTTFKSLFRQANLWGATENNPVREVKIRKEKNEVLLFLTPEEYHRLVKAAGNEYLRAAIALAVGTMLRKENLFSLKWENCDMTRRLITVPGVLTKNGEALNLPMIEPVYEVLRELPKSLHSPYILTNPVTGKRYSQGMRKAFERAKKLASINPAFRWHDLRHTGASWYAQEGVDIYTIKDLLGHKDIKTTQRYAHLSPDYRKRQAEKISNRFEACGDSMGTLTEGKI